MADSWPKCRECKDTLTNHREGMRLKSGEFLCLPCMKACCENYLTPIKEGHHLIFEELGKVKVAEIHPGCYQSTVYVEGEGQP